MDNERQKVLCPFRKCQNTESNASLLTFCSFLYLWMEKISFGYHQHRLCTSALIKQKQGLSILNLVKGLDLSKSRHMEQPFVYQVLLLLFFLLSNNSVIPHKARVAWVSPNSEVRYERAQSIRQKQMNDIQKTFRTTAGLNNNRTVSRGHSIYALDLHLNSAFKFRGEQIGLYITFLLTRPGQNSI